MFDYFRWAKIKFITFRIRLTLGKSYSDLVFFSKPTIYYPAKMSIGKRVSVNDGFWVDARGGVKIGDNVLIGPGVKIITVGHGFRSLKLPIRDQDCEIQPITIGDDVWLGAGSIILPGVSVGKGAVVAAGAVVTHNIEPYSVVAGVPARVIKKRMV